MIILQLDSEQLSVLLQNAVRTVIDDIPRSEALSKISGKPFRMRDAADYLGVSTQTVYNYIASGKIRPKKAGKFNLFYQTDLDAFIKGEKPEKEDPSQFIKNKKPRL